MLCKVFQAYDAMSLEKMINTFLKDMQIQVRYMQYATGTKSSAFADVEHFVVILYDRVV